MLPGSYSAAIFGKWIYSRDHIILVSSHKDVKGLPNERSALRHDLFRENTTCSQFTTFTHSSMLNKAKIIKDDYEGQMVFGDR